MWPCGEIHIGEKFAGSGMVVGLAAGECYNTPGPGTEGRCYNAALLPSAWLMRAWIMDFAGSRLRSCQVRAHFSSIYCAQ